VNERKKDATMTTNNTDTTTTLDLAAIKAAFATVQEAYDTEASLQADLDAATLARATAIKALAALVPSGMKLRHPTTSVELSIVVGGGKGGNSVFIRGMNPSAPKAARKAVIEL
jgi:hypothetical protein